MGLVLAAIVGAGALALAVALLRFNAKRIAVIRVAERLTDASLHHIYGLVESSGHERSDAFVLGRLNAPAPTDQHIISVPQGLPSFPWSDHRIALSEFDELSLRLAPSEPSAAQLNGRTYRLVRVPQNRTAAGKPRRVYVPERYTAANTELLHALRSIEPNYPFELLSYLLCAGHESFEFDSVDQARINGSPAWMQGGEFPLCNKCRRRLRFMIQIPGTMLRAKRLREATVYVFGCVAHPDMTKVLSQFS